MREKERCEELSERERQTERPLSDSTILHVLDEVLLAGGLVVTLRAGEGGVQLMHRPVGSRLPN